MALRRGREKGLRNLHLNERVEHVRLQLDDISAIECTFSDSNIYLRNTDVTAPQKIMHYIKSDEAFSTIHDETPPHNFSTST